MPIQPAPAVAAPEPSSSRPVRPARRFGWAAALLGLALVLALLAAFIFYRLETWPRRNLAGSAEGLEHLAGRVRDALVAIAQVQPRVTVNDRVVFEQASPVLELAVVSRQAEVSREFTKSWLGSTKRIRLRGLYEIKAGYDLRGQPFAVSIEGAGNAEAVKIALPPARLLGTEQKNVEVLEMKNGLWNRIQPDELESELNALAEQARQKALQAELPREAEETFARQVRERLGADGRRVEITNLAPTPPSPAAPAR